jgi:hypothetical protein
MLHLKGQFYCSDIKKYKKQQEKKNWGKEKQKKRIKKGRGNANEKWQLHCWEGIRISYGVQQCCSWSSTDGSEQKAVWH